MVIVSTRTKEVASAKDNVEFAMLRVDGLDLRKEGPDGAIGRTDR